MLGQRRRQWANINTALHKRFVFAGSKEARSDIDPMLGWCWASVEDDEPALTQRRFNVLGVLKCTVNPLQTVDAMKTNRSQHYTLYRPG